MILRRGYKSIQGTKVRIIDDFSEHYKWMNENKPTLAILYFHNAWNPECSRDLKKWFINRMEHEAFEAFMIDCQLGTQGERTQKYYCVKYQPTFLMLSDGLEVKSVVGSDTQEIDKQIERVKRMRTVIKWDLGIQPGKEIWEKYHAESLFMWHSWDEKESWEGEGLVHLDRN